MKKIKNWKNALVSAVLAVAVVITGMSLTASPAQAQSLVQEDLGIFYGYPSYINGANGNVAQAVEAFKPFEVIVLGDKVEHPSHGDYANSKQIIAQLVPNGNKVFGYVPIGTSCCGNLTNDQIKTNIDEWKTIGATGIFMDEFGFDYLVTRAKQNELVDYAHAKGMKVIANAWVPVDAMGNKDENGATVNTKLGDGDYFLMEDWIAEQGNLQASTQWVAKADSALALSQQTGVKIAILATSPDPDANVNGEQFKLATYATAMYGFDAFQWTKTTHSSDNNIMHTYQLPQNYGTSFTESTVTHNSDYTVMTRKTNTGTFTVTQNATTKNAEFVVSATPTPTPVTPTPTPVTPTPTPVTPTPTPTPAEPTPAPTTPPTDNSNLQAQIDALRTDITQLRTENQSLRDKISIIKSIFDNAKTASDALNN